MSSEAGFGVKKSCHRVNLGRQHPHLQLVSEVVGRLAHWRASNPARNVVVNRRYLAVRREPVEKLAHPSETNPSKPSRNRPNVAARTKRLIEPVVGRHLDHPNRIRM
ncbi:MAG TPA: hypothetical protein VHV31_09970, partial [Nitrolancea sp.]|nr:hypothetical protein [Nitrolancea sp.]